MTDRPISERPTSDAQGIVKPLSDAHALKALPDGPFIAYALMQGFKMTMTLFIKRWPQLESRVRYD